MKNIVIEFDPANVAYYVSGPKFHQILWEFSSLLRERYKYKENGKGNDHETVENIREDLRNIWDDIMYSDIEII